MNATDAPSGLTQTEARRKAKELGGIAIWARWSKAKQSWDTGGWANQPGEVWIVVSVDRKSVLLDHSDNPPLTVEKLRERAEAKRASVVKGSRGGYVLKDSETGEVISRHATLESLEDAVNNLDRP